MILRWFRRRMLDRALQAWTPPPKVASVIVTDPQLRRVFVRLNACCVDRAREYPDDADAAVVVAELDRLCREMLAERDERHAETRLNAAWMRFREGVIRAAMRGGAR